MRAWTVALVLDVLIAAMLIASLAIHDLPPTCFGDGRNVPGDPCYEPAA